MLRGRVYTTDLNLNRGNRISVACAGLLWMALLAAPLWPVTLLVALFPAIILLGLNRQLFRFFYEERGFRFALATIPWVWLYYTYSGLCIVLGVWAYLRSKGHTTRRVLRFKALREAERTVAA